jgi:Flp pilus assembly protein TadG
MTSHLNRLIRGLSACAAGVAATEAAFALPMLLTFGFGITETGRAIWIQNQLQFAVEAAARCYAFDVNNCPDAARTKAYAAAQIAAYSVPTTTFTVTTPACGKMVSASLPFNNVVSGLVPFSLNLTASSCHS